MTKRQSAIKDKIQRKYDAMTTLRSLAMFASKSLKNVTEMSTKELSLRKKKQKNVNVYDSDTGKSKINPIESWAYTQQQRKSKIL